MTGYDNLLRLYYKTLEDVFGLVGPDVPDVAMSENDEGFKFEIGSHQTCMVAVSKDYEYSGYYVEAGQYDAGSFTRPESFEWNQQDQVYSEFETAVIEAVKLFFAM